MSDNNEFTFAAVVTIRFPAEEGSAQLDVTLAATDHIETGDGAFKPLGDCTLAELRRFADSLEAEAWAQFKGVTLSELVSRNQADVTFSIASELPESIDLETFSLLKMTSQDEEAGDHGDNSESDRVSDSELKDAQQAELSEDSSADAGEADGDAPGETTFTDQENVSPPEIAEEVESDVSAGEPEPQVTVAESEPVHEDREAAPLEEEDEALAVVRPKIRILGKRRPLNHHTWTAVDILVNESAFRDAQAHALSSPHREVAGVLVGPQPEKQPDGRYVVHISDTIIARHTRMQGASVTYTPESWRYVNDRMAELFPDGTAVIVGWYHTHPGFGIFLSGMDQFIHQNFFTQIWHVAMVLDPLAGNSGFFCWNREKDKVAAYDFPWPEWASESW